MNNTTISTTLKSLLVAIGAAANVNLLDAAAASNLGTVAANVVVAAGASSSQAAATNLATNIQSLSLATGALNNYEAIVQVAQDSTSLRDATYSVDAGKFQVQNQDLTIQNARAVVVNGLRLVPFCDLIVGQTVACNPTEVGPWLAFTRLTGFQLTAVNGSIRVNGSGDLFTSFSFTNGMVADYRAASGSWKYIQPNVSSVMEISLGVSFKDPTDVVRTGNLLQICNASGSCVPYYLADRAGVCSLVSGDSTGLLAKINALNAPALNTTCP